MAQTLDPHLIIPTKKSSDLEWLAWYDNLKSFFGKKDARTAFVKAWSVRGNSSANTSQFREKMRKEGVDISSDTIAGSISDAADGVMDSISSSLKMGKMAMVVIGVIVVLLVILIVYRLATPQTVSAVLARK